MTRLWSTLVKLSRTWFLCDIFIWILKGKLGVNFFCEREIEVNGVSIFPIENKKIFSLFSLEFFLEEKLSIFSNYFRRKKNCPFSLSEFFMILTRNVDIWRSLIKGFEVLDEHLKEWLLLKKSTWSLLRKKINGTESLNSI